MASSSERSFLVVVNGISGTFQTKTGGDTTSDVTMNYNGGSTTPELLAAPAATANIIVSRSYDHSRDYQAHKNARAQVGRWSTNISVTPTDADLNSLGSPTQYPNALLVRVSEPDVDSSSGSVAMFELEFAIGAVK